MSDVLKNLTDYLQNEFGVTAYPPQHRASVTALPVCLWGDKPSTIANEAVLKDAASSCGLGQQRISWEFKPDDSLLYLLIPNSRREIVAWRPASAPMSFYLGQGSSHIDVDLKKMPHVLICGTTGSGKSNMMHAIVLGLMSNTPASQLQFMFIDPKRGVEFGGYADLPYTRAFADNATSAVSALADAANHMDDRYEILKRLGARDIQSYNNKAEKQLPFFVVVIDEMADLILTSEGAVEEYIVRLAQMGRAAGIHLVAGTQSPRAEILTGLIRINIAERIVFKVSNHHDSKVALDVTGAEDFQGNGDGAYKSKEAIMRFQAPFVSDSLIASRLDIAKVPTGAMDLWWWKPRSAVIVDKPGEFEFDEWVMVALQSGLEGGLSATQLAKTLGVSQGTALARLRSLRDMGLIEPYDKTTKVSALSELGVESIKGFANEAA